MDRTATATMSASRTGVAGTRRAVRESGRATAARIVEAAYRLLRTQGLGEFSMRRVAKEANVRLAGVQYYFPAMQDLVREIIALNARLYSDAYHRAVAAHGRDARGRLEAIIAFNLDDIQDIETRGFFIHLWSLLETLDGFSGSLLAELYEAQFALLRERIVDLHPRINASEAQRRAELVAALIEGMFITLPKTGADSGFDRVKESAMQLCLAIADGDY
jgi:AcrR family transcriptional regulator